MAFLNEWTRPLPPSYLVKAGPHELPYLSRLFIVGASHFTECQIEVAHRRALEARNLHGIGVRYSRLWWSSRISGTLLNDCLNLLIEYELHCMAGGFRANSY